MFVNNDCYVGGGIEEGGKRLWVITGYDNSLIVLIVVPIWAVSQPSYDRTR